MPQRHITRICAACKKDVAISDQYCPACGIDTQSAIIADEPHALWQKAETVLPVALTLGMVILRVGFKLGRTPWLRHALSLWIRRSDMKDPAPTSLARQSREGKPRRIRIRSRWVVQDAQGREQKGTEEHLIDIS